MQVSCPKDYEQWLQTMYVLFGTKFSKIFRGPMWSCDSINQGTGYMLAEVQDPLQVNVHVKPWSLLYIHRALLFTNRCKNTQHIVFH